MSIPTNQRTHVEKNIRILSKFISKSLNQICPRSKNLPYYGSPVDVSVDVNYIHLNDKKGWCLEDDELSNPRRSSGLLVPVNYCRDPHDPFITTNQASKHMPPCRPFANPDFMASTTSRAIYAGSTNTRFSMIPPLISHQWVATYVKKKRKPIHT